MMSILNAPFEPSWGVPLVGLIIGIAGCLWAYLSDKAFTRKHGPDRR